MDTTHTYAQNRRTNVSAEFGTEQERFESMHGGNKKIMKRY